MLPERRGDDLLEELQLFAGTSVVMGGQPRHVAARAREAGDAPFSYGWFDACHDDRNGLVAPLPRRDAASTARDDDVYPESHQLGGQRGSRSSALAALLDGDGLPSTQPSSRRPWRKAAMRGRQRPGASKKPIR